MEAPGSPQAHQVFHPAPAALPPPAPARVRPPAAPSPEAAAPLAGDHVALQAQHPVNLHQAFEREFVHLPATPEQRPARSRMPLTPTTN